MQIAKVPLPALVRNVIPFLIPMIGILFLLTYVPQIVLFLPNLFK
jgi:C4-dicarboxylate transporter DctM subunit